MNITEILDRIKVSAKIKTDTELAKILEISQSGLSTWKNRNTLDLSQIVKVCNMYSLNLNYIINGIGEPYLEAKSYEKKEDNLFVKETESEYIAKLENELKKTDADIQKEHKEIAHLDNELLKLKRQHAIENQEIKNRLALIEMLLIQKNKS